MRNFYPPIKPYQEHKLKLDDIHTAYIEECGNRDGIPVLFIHGGPGAGCSAQDRCFFDPDKYRIILYDQRGSGRSTPHASLDENHSQALIEDIERIREHLKIESWILFGGSWGSTLSLLYAIHHADRIMAMVLRGIFLCRPQDLLWFYQEGASRLFPDHWQAFYDFIPEKERGNLIKAYYHRLTGNDELVRMAAAKIWSTWEGLCATLHPNKQVVDKFTDPHNAMSIARIEAHYFQHHIFFPKNYILDHAHVLADIPATLVHGRYDVICPLDNATSLAAILPKAQLNIIRDAGHAGLEPGIVDALVRATNAYANLFA